MTKKIICAVLSLCIAVCAVSAAGISACTLTEPSSCENKQAIPQMAIIPADENAEALDYMLENAKENDTAEKAEDDNASKWLLLALMFGLWF